MKHLSIKQFRRVLPVEKANPRQCDRKKRVRLGAGKWLSQSNELIVNTDKEHSQETQQRERPELQSPFTKLNQLLRGT